MVNNHIKTFFGENTSLTVKSNSKEESFIYITILNKKDKGEWEKLTSGEAKTIKCSMEEIVSILHVLKHEIKEWSNYHIYNDQKTKILFQLVSDNLLEVQIHNRSIKLKFEQIEILKLLLKHLLKEKIVYATSSQIITENKRKNEEKDKKKIVQESEKTEMKGSIKGKTDKAILIKFEGEQEAWVPKSAIHSKIIDKIGIDQLFLIENGVLEKNRIL
ncbi:MAG: hypothetical protein ACFFAN_21145 [Promethearchaeota archaeon]